MAIMETTADYADKVTDPQALEASKLRVCHAKVEGDIASETIVIPSDMEDTTLLGASISNTESQIKAAHADHVAHPERTGGDYVAVVGPLKDARRQALADLRDMEARNAVRISAAEAEYRDRVAVIEAKKTDITKDLESLYSLVTI